MLHKFTNRYREIRSGGLLRECASMFYPFNIKTLQQVSLVLLKMRRQRMIFRSDVGFFYFATSLSVFGSVLFGHFQRARHTDIYDSCQTWQDNDPSGKVSRLHLGLPECSHRFRFVSTAFFGTRRTHKCAQQVKVARGLHIFVSVQIEIEGESICLNCKMYFSTLQNVFVQMSRKGQGLSWWIEAGLRSKEKLDESNSRPFCICSDFLPANGRWKKLSREIIGDKANYPGQGEGQEIIPDRKRGIKEGSPPTLKG